MKVLPRRRRAVLINSVLGVVVLAGAGGAYAAVNSGDGGGARSSGARVVTVAKGTVLATVSGSGTLASPNDAGVDFTTGGTLTEVDVKPGDKVAKGQVLAKVDPTDAKETLQQDQASLTAAEANLTKVEAGELVSTGSSGSSGSTGSSDSRAATPSPTPSPTYTVDPAQLASAQAQLTQAQNAVDADQRAVDGTTLKAPVSGTVASVSAAKGQSVSGTTASGSGGGTSSGSGSNSSSSTSSSSSGAAPTGFVVLTNPSGMQVTADFSEADSLKVKPGQAATVTLNAQSGTVLNAKVLSVSSLPVSSSSGGTSGSSAVQYAATLSITSPTATLRTGLSASIQVVTGSASGALNVPTAAVTGTGANRTVTVVNSDGSTTRTPVTVGVEGDSADQITSGLTEGQQVQIAAVASAGNGGFPSGAFPGGLGGGGGRFGGAGGAGARTGAGAGAGGRG